MPRSHHHHSGLYYSYGGARYYAPYDAAYYPQTSSVVQVYRPSYGATVTTAKPIVSQSVRLTFGGFQRLEDLASRFEFEANRWCLDMHYNYQGNPDFAATYREAYGILQAAKFVHAAEHREDHEAIRGQLAAVEPAFHRVQERVKSWRRNERRPIGADGVNGKGEVMESILHHLLFDVGIEADHSEGDEVTEEQAPPPSAEDITLPPPPAALSE